MLGFKFRYYKIEHEKGTSIWKIKLLQNAYVNDQINLQDKIIHIDFYILVIRIRKEYTLKLSKPLLGSTLNNV